MTFPRSIQDGRPKVRDHNIFRPRTFFRLLYSHREKHIIACMHTYVHTHTHTHTLSCRCRSITARCVSFSSFCIGPAKKILVAGGATVGAIVGSISLRDRGTKAMLDRIDEAFPGSVSPSHTHAHAHTQNNIIMIIYFFMDE